MGLASIDRNTSPQIGIAVLSHATEATAKGRTRARMLLTPPADLTLIRRWHQGEFPFDTLHAMLTDDRPSLNSNAWHTKLPKSISPGCERVSAGRFVALGDVSGVATRMSEATRRTQRERGRAMNARFSLKTAGRVVVRTIGSTSAHVHHFSDAISTYARQSRVYRP